MLSPVVNIQSLATCWEHVTGQEIYDFESLSGDREVDDMLSKVDV